MPERHLGLERAPHNSDTGQSPSPALESWAEVRKQAADRSIKVVIVLPAAWLTTLIERR